MGIKTGKRKLKGISLICCALLLAMTIVPFTAFETGGAGLICDAVTAADGTGAAAASDLEEKTVTIGWYHSDLFQEGRSDSDPKSGYCYEYINKISDYNGWKYEYVYGDWTELLEKLENGEIDLLAGVSKTDERMDRILYPDNVMGYEHYILYHHEYGDMDGTNISTFKGKVIGAIKNNLMTDYLEQWIAEHDADVQIVYYDNFEERDQDFKDDKIDALVTTSNGVLATSGYAQLAEVGKESYYLAVSKDRPDLLEDLNRAQGYLQDIEPYFISNLEYDNYGTTLANSTLSTFEKQWLDEHSSITIGCVDDYLPYCDADENGEVIGLITNVMDAMLNELDIADRVTVDYKIYSSDEEIMEAVKNGEIDAAFPVSGETWQLEQEGINATNAVVNTRAEFVYTGEYPEDGKIGKTAIPKGNTMVRNYLEDVFPDAEIVEYDNIEECLDAVKDGEIGSTTLDGFRTDLVKLNRKYSSLEMRQLDRKDDRCIGVAMGNTGLQMLLNRGLMLVGTEYGSIAASYYTSGLYEQTTADFVFDHRWIFITLALLIALLIGIFVCNDIRQNRKILRIEEERNRQLSERQAELEKARADAEAANAAKTSFLFNMSHDIRTPMNAIIGFRDLLEKHQDDPVKRKDYLDKIADSSSILLSIINNVLEMARIEKGTIAVEEVAWNAGRVTDNLYDVFDEMMREKHIRFTRSVNIQHQYIYCDPTKLREVFINLLSNACKYSEPGDSVDMHLEELPCDREGYGLYRMTIADTGIGMSEEFLPHLFEEFSRENNTTANKIEGTGLGMPIVKRLVELMDGTIEVQSKKGVGTTFTVTLPHRFAEGVTTEETVEVEFDPRRFEGRRILLAEDNDLNAEIACEILGEAGFKVERAEDGRIVCDMLARAADNYYDLILMDVQMPNMNGYEATKFIRQMEDPEKSRIPIIAMTANAFEEDKREALASGMDGHLAKPVDVKEILRTLAGVLRQ